MLNRMDATQTDLLPLCKRGIEGDLAEPGLAATVKSPLPPFFKEGVSRCFNLTDY